MADPPEFSSLRPARGTGAAVSSMNEDVRSSSPGNSEIANRSETSMIPGDVRPPLVHHNPNRECRLSPRGISSYTDPIYATRRSAFFGDFPVRLLAAFAQGLGSAGQAGRSSQVDAQAGQNSHIGINTNACMCQGAWLILKSSRFRHHCTTTQEHAFPREALHDFRRRGLSA
jgi:hypothetical protein